jgi:malto-oligosyltrehalose trehalohydrolase
VSDLGERRAHRMPFGAELREGGVRFGLWAPAAERVELQLVGPVEADERRLPMQAKDGGWWSLETGLARAGSLYQYRVDGQAVPDPASRYQPRDVHGPSQVIDPRDFDWHDGGWRGRPWEEAVLYELHVGAFTRGGDFESARQRLGDLARLGITAVELMPLADFPGERNWGYDGVLPFAPDASYGRPEDLKRLVDEAHRLGLMVLLDVVYNHFGPEGNYLHLYAPTFFHPERTTPWGKAINFDGPGCREVREFFLHNVLYWLEEFHLDGLRLDAVHAIEDDSSPSFLDDLARRVRQGPGADREIHLVLENHDNQAHLLEPGRETSYTAQWNDDVHHAFHCALTGEAGGYYADYAAEPTAMLARGLAEGFIYQGEHSAYGGGPRGEPSAHLPPVACVNFLQNHDQIGNRAFGERLTELSGERELEAVLTVLLLAPAPPMLFMGEEYGARRPFLFFCDFGPDLARAVTEGRRREFARFPEFADPAKRERIPDPSDPRSFERSRLDWNEAESEAGRRRWRLCKELLDLRRREIVPRLRGVPGGAARYETLEERSFRVGWSLRDGARLSLVAHLAAGAGPRVARPAGRRLAPAGKPQTKDGSTLLLDAWSAAWFLEEPA